MVYYNFCGQLTFDAVCCPFVCCCRALAESPPPPPLELRFRLGLEAFRSKLLALGHELLPPGELWDCDPFPWP